MIWVRAATQLIVLVLICIMVYILEWFSFSICVQENIGERDVCGMSVLKYMGVMIGDLAGVDIALDVIYDDMGTYDIWISKNKTYDDSSSVVLGYLCRFVGMYGNCGDNLNDNAKISIWPHSTKDELSNTNCSFLCIDIVGNYTCNKKICWLNIL